MQKGAHEQKAKRLTKEKAGVLTYGLLPIWRLNRRGRFENSQTLYNGNGIFRFHSLKEPLVTC